MTYQPGRLLQKAARTRTPHCTAIRAIVSLGGRSFSPFCPFPPSGSSRVLKRAAIRQAGDAKSPSHSRHRVLFLTHCLISLETRELKGNCHEEKKERFAGDYGLPAWVHAGAPGSKGRGVVHTPPAQVKMAAAKGRCRPHSEAQPQSILGFPRVQLFLEDFSEVSAGSAPRGRVRPLARWPT